MPEYIRPSTREDELALQEELRPDVGRWKRHMLGHQGARTWLEWAGGLSTLQIYIVDGGWPYARINGEPLKLPDVECWQRSDPPLDPSELCRSVTTDDECWLFSCECSVHMCGGIDRGVLVAHDEGFTIWRCPECPEVPLAVFERRRYRKVILAAVKRLLKGPQRGGGLTWAMAVRPRYLQSALNRARAGQIWFK